MPSKPGPKTPWQKQVRYQRRRSTFRLRPWQVAAIHVCDDHAQYLGYHLNLVVTIVYPRTGVDPLKQFSAMRDHLGKWFHRKRMPMAMVYVHENPHGNFHTHMLIHLPGSRIVEFSKFLNSANESNTGPAADIKIQRRYPPEKDRILQYLCKGTDRETALSWGGMAVDQGEVIGKRCGWTENLGKKARAHCGEGSNASIVHKLVVETEERTSE